MIWPALWVWVALGAALAQAARFVLQRRMTLTGISPAGATFARFAFAAPVVALLAAVYARGSGQGWPQVPPHFWPYAMIGGLAQILATMATLALFRHRNFAVGITFKKTEVLLSALVGFVVLGDAVSPRAVLAIGIGFAGVLLLSRAGGAARIWSLPSALGLAAGGLFAISGVAYRGASLSLVEGDALLRACVTLACVTTFQTIIMGVGFALYDPGQLCAVLRRWRVAGLIALSSMLGSLGWFTAFTLQNVALVKAVGQVELVFSILATWLIFKQKITDREFLAITLIAASVVILVLGI